MKEELILSEERNHFVHIFPAAECGEAKLAMPSVRTNAIGTASRAHTFQSYPSTLCR